jgi:hypothetical protein
MIKTRIIMALSMALFGLLVSSLAAGALEVYAFDIATPEFCPWIPPAKSDWCSSNAPLKEEVPGLGE